MLRKILKAAAFAAGMTLTEQTECAAILNLITRLKPRDCGRKLVRIGGDADGGYLVPDDLEGIQYCFSPGVGSTVSFQDHLANLGITCFLADGSMSSPPINRAEFIFEQKFLSSTRTDSSFTLDSWLEECLNADAGDLLLQMDIEGSEYEVLIPTPPDTLKRFRIMVIEFHDLHRLFNSSVFKFYRACFERILEHFYVAHIHPNNCCGSLSKGRIEIPRICEFTFYNKARVGVTKYQSTFPHPLDRSNVSQKRPLPLPNCWYAAERSK